MTTDPTPIIFNDAFSAANVVIGHGSRLTVIQDGQPIELPSRADLLAYLDALRDLYARWADQPDDPEPPLLAQSDNPEQGPDSYIDTQAKPLPMRLAEFRPLPGQQEPPAQELLTALAGATRTIILGEPGSGKTTALERLAWVMASQSLNGRGQGRLILPLFGRLADYGGEADIVPILRRSLNRTGDLALNDRSVRLLLRAKDVAFVLLLDGLNELPQAHVESGAGPAALRCHLEDYPHHTLHLTCRTADFDPALQAEPLPLLPGAALWSVQPLADEIRYFDDDQGHSDVRDYLRRHLGRGPAKQLYERIRADDRLRELARLPLFLWMFKETGADGELPPDRGRLVRGFVRARRLLGRIPQKQRTWAEASLEAVAWAMQEEGSLEIEAATLYPILEQVRGPRSYNLDGVCGQLQSAGLLVDLGGERYRLLHQLVQEYGAAAYLIRQADCGAQLPTLAQDEWWRETCILALWLRTDLHTPAYLLGLMGDPAVDLRVRVAAAEILAQVGDPRFQPTDFVWQGRTVQAIEPNMVPIPGGTAILGGPGGDSDELPESQVKIAPFELAVHPVTNAEYRCFMDAKGYDDDTLWTPAGQAWLRGEGKLDPESDRQYRQIHQALREDVEGLIRYWREAGQNLSDELADAYRTLATWEEDRFVQLYAGEVLGEQRREPYYWHDRRFNQDNQPVVGINWYEAMAYAAWLGRVTGKAYVLPTEAQWEWAARRNSGKTDRRYPWGDEWEVERCNSSESRLGRPSPVGVYPQGATPDGLHDLAGNVYEWTGTLYRPYPYESDDDRESAQVDGLRVARGGSWYNGPAQVRCAFRYWNLPWYWGNDWGYRLARFLSQ